MAGGRKTPAGRSTSNARLQVPPNNSCSFGIYGNIEDKKNLTDNIVRMLSPKHVPFPSVSVDGHLLFETVSLGVITIFTLLQFLNLYKTVWWLPHSFQEYTINFQLIDPYLILFIGTFSTRQIICALLCKFIENVAPLRWVPTLQKIARSLLLMVIFGILGWCICYIGEKHNVIKVVYLCYPILMYFMIFGTNIEPFFDACTTPIYLKEDKKIKYILDKPMHNCSVNSVAIRAEIAHLREDFNRRLKKALFTSFGSAYLCGIAPLIFVPQHLHFDLNWVIQYTVLIWLGRVGAYFAQAYPIRYCDVLHRAALHLGKWTKVQVKISILPIQTWSDTVLWPHGSVVKHDKDYYRSDSLCTAAEPGDLHHSRFFALFGNPTVVQSWMLAMHLTLVAVQLLILFHTTEWYKIISLSLLIVLNNYYALYRLTRDYLVSWRIYRAEQILQEKVQLALLSENH